MVDFEEITEDIQEAPKKIVKWFEKNKVLGISIIVVGVVALYTLYKRKSTETVTETSTSYGYVPESYDGYPTMSESATDYNSIVSDLLTETEDINTSYHDTILSDVSQIVDDVITSNNETLEDIISSYNQDKIKFDETLSYLEEKNEREKVISQMQMNSNLYNVTTDEEYRKKLHQQNLELGQSIGATFESNSGTWWLNGEQLYKTNVDDVKIKGVSSQPTGTDRNTTPVNTGDITKVIEKMKENSMAWNNTTDKEKQKQLAEENQKLGASIGATYNANTGTWWNGNERLYTTEEEKKTTNKSTSKNSGGVKIDYITGNGGQKIAVVKK